MSDDPKPTLPPAPPPLSDSVYPALERALAAIHDAYREALGQATAELIAELIRQGVDLPPDFPEQLRRRLPGRTEQHLGPGPRKAALGLAWDCYRSGVEKGKELAGKYRKITPPAFLARKTPNPTPKDPTDV